MIIQEKKLNQLIKIILVSYPKVSKFSSIDSKDVLLNEPWNFTFK